MEDQNNREDTNPVPPNQDQPVDHTSPATPNPEQPEVGTPPELPVQEQTVDKAPPEPPIQSQPVDNVPPVTPIQDQARDDIPPLKPTSWLWQSIAATILCCNILGVIGVVYAARVDTLYYNFKYAEAEKASKNARMWTLISVALGILTLVLWGVLSTSSEFMSAMEGIIENNASGYNF